MISTIKALLKSSKGAFSPQVEFWHDYFSVPQWNERIQKSLLLDLPSIYHTADEILVQMSEIPQQSPATSLLGDFDTSPHAPCTHPAAARQFLVQPSQSSQFIPRVPVT